MIPGLEFDVSEELASPLTDTTADGYRVSAAPIIPERIRSQSGTEADELGLPRSYGLETLWLMARDPHNLYAYWDIDWRAAFAEENPAPRLVQLRLLKADGSTETTQEVEPMAGHCRVTVADADASYCAEIGFLDPNGAWRLVSRSESVFVPPASAGASDPANFATVPMHLSFQRMLDATRSLQEEDDSLTDTLAELQQRATDHEKITTQQREVVQAIAEAAAREPAPPALPADGKSRDLWARHSLEQIFGFGNASLSRGFGGSSRS